MHGDCSVVSSNCDISNLGRFDRLLAGLTHAVPTAADRNRLARLHCTPRSFRAEIRPGLHQASIAIAVAQRKGVVELWRRFKVQCACCLVFPVLGLEQLEHIFRLCNRQLYGFRRENRDAAAYAVDHIVQEQDFIEMRAISSQLNQRLHDSISKLGQIGYPSKRDPRFRRLDPTLGWLARCLSHCFHMAQLIKSESSLDPDAVQFLV